MIFQHKVYSNEMAGMIKKNEGLEALVKFMFKQQNPYLDEKNDCFV